MDKMYDVGIIGAGPAGYTLAIRLAQKNIKVIIFEKNFVGGTCLNYGCIPTKTILHSCSLFDKLQKSQKFGVYADNVKIDFEKIYERKTSVVEKMRNSLEKMIKSYDIKIVQEDAIINSQTVIKTKNDIYNCKKIVVATGSDSIKLNSLPDNENILNSNKILDLKEIPKNLIIIGSGAIGIEWARMFSIFGTNVSLIELSDKLLPIADFEVSQRLERILKRNKVKIYTSNTIVKLDENTATLKNGEKIVFDKILVAVGRKPILPNSEIPFETDEKGRAIVNENYKNKNGIYVIGDASSKIQLAHNAIHQAIQLSNYISQNVSSEKFIVPSVIYGDPEIAWVGKTEQELQNENYKQSVYPISALGKAQADGEIEGFVKLLSVDEVLVGAHIIAPEASSMICEFIYPIQNKIEIGKLAQLCHPHPTYSEASFEAIFGLHDCKINVMKGF